MNEIKIEISLEVYKALVMRMTYANQPFDEILKSLLSVNPGRLPETKVTIPMANSFYAKNAKKGIESKGRYADEKRKKFVVLQGSKICELEDPSIPERYQQIRGELCKDGIVDSKWIFTKNHVFNSISEAASVIYGGSRNGYNVWMETSI